MLFRPFLGQELVYPVILRSKTFYVFCAFSLPFPDRQTKSRSFFFDRKSANASDMAKPADIVNLLSYACTHDVVSLYISKCKDTIFLDIARIFFNNVSLRSTPHLNDSEVPSRQTITGDSYLKLLVLYLRFRFELDFYSLLSFCRLPFS